MRQEPRLGKAKPSKAVRSEGCAPAAAIYPAEAAAGPDAPTPTPMECVEGADLVDSCLTPLPTIATPTPTPIVYTTTTITVRKYYFFGSQRVAVRETNESHNYLHYLHWDHLGSTVLTTWNSSGTRQSERAYYAFGDDRRTVNTPLTDHLFTGQKQDDTGLYYYNARYYDPEIGHFISPDTIVPDPLRVDAYNRYMYSLGNPLKFNDPTGHAYEIGGGSLWPTLAIFANGINQTAGVPAEQGLQLQKALQAATDIDVYVPQPVYTSGSPIVDSVHVYWGSATDAITPGSQVNRMHPAAVNMNRYIDADVSDGDVTFYPHQTVHLIAHSGGGAYVDDLAQHLINEYGVQIETIITLGSPLVNYNESLAMADKLTMITALNDPLGWAPLSDPIAHFVGKIDDSFSFFIFGPQEDGHTGYGQNPEVIQYLIELYAK